MPQMIPMCFGTDSKQYREMLDELGLGAFIPKTPTREKSSSFLKDWTDYPDLLIDLVDHYQDQIKPFLPNKQYKWLEKNKRIEKAFENKETVIIQRKVKIPFSVFTAPAGVLPSADGGSGNLLGKALPLGLAMLGGLALRCLSS